MMLGGGKGGLRFGTLNGTHARLSQGRGPGRAGIFLGQIVSVPLSPLCSRNWPCRSNSPRRWRPASCPARSPLLPQPSVPCRGPWPSGLPPQQPPPSSQLPSWARLCFAPQREPSALPQGPSSLPPTRLPGEAGAWLPAVAVLASFSRDASGFLHPPGDCHSQPRASCPI